MWQKIVYMLCTFICGDMKYKCKKREYKTVSSKVCYILWDICDFVWLYFFKDFYPAPSIFPLKLSKRTKKIFGKPRFWILWKSDKYWQSVF